LRARLGIPRFSQVFVSGRALEVVALGYVRPMVLLPAAMVAQMQPQMLEAVIAHELAHIRRFDLWVNLGQRVMETLLFYHPAVWWLSHQLRSERELCCDELAVKATGQRLTYASALESAGRVQLAGGQPALAVGLGQGKRRTLSRVRHVLGLPPSRPDSRFWLAGAIAMVVLAVLAMPTASVLTAGTITQAATTQKPGPPESRLEGDVNDGALPAGWRLDYDNGLRAGGSRIWPSQMADDLVSLEILRPPEDPCDTRSKTERYRFRIHSPAGTEVGTIHTSPGFSPGGPRARKILKPDAYWLHYRREGGKNPDNFWMHSGPFRVNLAEPGMYKLRFAPKLGHAEIKGSLGGCYVLNFQRSSGGFPIGGTVYQYPPKEYRINGLPGGTYRLSAVTQRDGPNVFVSQAQAIVEADETVTLNMTHPPHGNCSLTGHILGKPRRYEMPWEPHHESERRWFVLIRKRGSGPIKTTPAYEALTMDSLYVVRASRITQETEEKARYSIEGVAPGDYTVTAIEHPWWSGCTIERQQSKPLSLKANGRAVLDFDLRDTDGAKG
jgi:hypothetical protein